jgi:hypothetical protein
MAQDHSSTSDFEMPSAAIDRAEIVKRWLQVADEMTPHR